MVNYLWTSQECIVKVPLAFLQSVFEILIFLLGIVGAIFWCRKELMFKGLVIMYICVFIYIYKCMSICSCRLFCSERVLVWPQWANCAKLAWEAWPPKCAVPPLCVFTGTAASKRERQPPQNSNKCLWSATKNPNILLLCLWMYVWGSCMRTAMSAISFCTGSVKSLVITTLLWSYLLMSLRDFNRSLASFRKYGQKARMPI